MALVENFIHLFTESAPYLLLGMFIAGLINQAVPRSWVSRVLGKDASVFTASVIGAPLPLCSCSVIPVAMGIRRQGASKASTASFLVATPETGVDSVGLTYALMGPVMAIARPIAAIFSAVVAGISIKLLGTPEDQGGTVKETPSSCCQTACCNTKPSTDPQKTRFSLKQVFEYGYGKLLKDFMGWLLVGLAFAAIIQTYVPAGFLANYGQGLVAMTVMVMISIPMYICATASTPIAVGLMLSGISPGAALVFMLTGPATNIATLMVVKKELGNREMLLYVAAVIVSALAAGYVLNLILSVTGWQISVEQGTHNEILSVVYQLSSVALAGLIAYQYALQAKSKWLAPASAN